MMSSSILLFSSTGWQGRKKKTHDTGRIKTRGRESDREEKTENNRETGGREESTSEHISFPRGKRGERGMLSGTSAMSHMRSVKDASDKRRLRAGRATAQVHQSTLTSCPCHAVGIFPLDRSLNHL